MPNICITSACNRSCPYCFAKDSTASQENDEHGFITLDNVKRVISFLKRSEWKIFSIIGGEPTVHPEFRTIVNMALKEDFSVFVFTNALCKESVATFLGDLPDDRLGILVNVNQKESYSERQYSQLTRSLSKFGSKASLGFNVYEPEFNFLPLAELINRYQNKQMIRIGLAQPILGKQNAHISPRDYPKIGGRLVSQAETCEQQNIRIGMDCGFPLCMFTYEQLGRLYAYHAELSFECKPVLDIGPNLVCWSCFPLSTWKRVNILDFENVTAVNDYFATRQTLYHHSGLHKACFSCRHIQRGQCKGGCISHVIAEYE